MVEPELGRLFPRFILLDRNGLAMAKALMRGLDIFVRTAEAGIACVLDEQAMPPWRLDEMARELNCLYDADADVEARRAWIRSALTMTRIYGTAQALSAYLSGYFDEVSIEEGREYGAEPYHFRVIVEGEWTQSKEAWARRAIETAKNVRSVLDGLRIGCKCRIAIMADGQTLARFPYRMTGEAQRAGEWPQACVRGELSALEAALLAQGEAWPFDYGMAGGERMAGTHPEQAEETCAPIAYRLCGADEL